MGLRTDRGSESGRVNVLRGADSGGWPRNAHGRRFSSVSGQTPVGPRNAAFRGRLLNGHRSFSWRLTSVGHDEAVGPLQVALAAVGAECDVHAGAT